MNYQSNECNFEEVAYAPQQQFAHSNFFSNLNASDNIFQNEQDATMV